MKTTDFAECLTKYLSVYLPGQRGISSNTITSYVYTFRLLMIYYRDNLKYNPEKLTLKQFDSNLIMGFLDWLERTRNNSVATRNQRLAAIHAFCRYLIVEEPKYMVVFQKNLCVPFKKYTKPQLGYLSVDEISAILAKPDLNTLKGRRDLTIISLLYDSGARVSEIANLKVRDVRIDEYPIVTLNGKGNKIRQVPIMKKTALLIGKYLSEQKLETTDHLDDPLFTNRQKQKLTRAGITYILRKYSNDKSISPHTLRHTKAMHLLQAGVSSIYIRDILGHTSVDTTSIYARADAEMKRKAIEKISNEPTPDVPDWTSDTALMDWLKSKT